MEQNVAPVAGLDTGIYGMPSFVSLKVNDMQTSLRWYAEGLGLHVLATMERGGSLALVHLRRWRYQDLLLVPATEPVHAGSTTSFSFAALASELDGLAESAARIGGGRVTGPQLMPWGTTDLTTVDPDGNTLIFTAPPAVLPTGPAPDGFTMTTHS